MADSVEKLRMLIHAALEVGFRRGECSQISFLTKISEAANSHAQSIFSVRVFQQNRPVKEIQYLPCCVFRSWSKRQESTRNATFVVTIGLRVCISKMQRICTVIMLTDEDPTEKPYSLTGFS